MSATDTTIVNRINQIEFFLRVMITPKILL